MGSSKTQTLSWTEFIHPSFVRFIWAKGVFVLPVSLSIFLLLMSWLRFFMAGLGKFYERWSTSWISNCLTLVLLKSKYLFLQSTGNWVTQTWQHSSPFSPCSPKFLVVFPWKCVSHSNIFTSKWHFQPIYKFFCPFGKLPNGIPPAPWSTIPFLECFVWFRKSNIPNPNSAGIGEIQTQRGLGWVCCFFLELKPQVRLGIKKSLRDL